MRWNCLKASYLDHHPSGGILVSGISSASILAFIVSRSCCSFTQSLVMEEKFRRSPLSLSWRLSRNSPLSSRARQNEAHSLTRCSSCCMTVVKCFSVSSQSNRDIDMVNVFWCLVSIKTTHENFLSRVYPNLTLFSIGCIFSCMQLDRKKMFEVKRARVYHVPYVWLWLGDNGAQCASKTRASPSGALYASVKSHDLKLLIIAHIGTLSLHDHKSSRLLSCCFVFI